MASGAQPLGTVASMWRYPVKSMQGEAIDGAAITERGVIGDRTCAVLDRATGHIASAKHPGKWGALFALFACRAAFAEPPRPDAPLRRRARPREASGAQRLPVSGTRCRPCAMPPPETGDDP